MICKILETEEHIIKNFILNDIFQNVYLYIDIDIYGFNGSNVKTFVLKDNNNEIKLILFHYYNSLQLFKIMELNDNDIQEVIKHIKEYNFNMISGLTELIQMIYNKVEKSYKMTNGYILKMDKINSTDKIVSERANIDDYDEIVKLICSDESIGGHYTFENLKEQLIDRRKNMGCKNLVIRYDNKIVCHIATYANSQFISVIGGLITDTNYRGRGYGKIILNDLVKIIQSEGKTPILYCYDNNIINWYLSLGWKKINTSSKLELICE